MKKVSKYRLKFKNKPWITKGTQKFIALKNGYFTKHITNANIHIKTF